MLPFPSPRTWWFTGLSGAGKTTLATAWQNELQAANRPALVLDGDELRRGLCADLGFSPQDREENMRRVAELAAWLNRTGLNAIVALVSPTLHGRERARQIIGAKCFVEIHVATPIDICRMRDPKGLYRKATQERFGLTGVDAPYETPLSPALTIDTSITSLAQSMQLLHAIEQNR